MLTFDSSYESNGQRSWLWRIFRKMSITLQSIIFPCETIRRFLSQRRLVFLDTGKQTVSTCIVQFSSVTQSYLTLCDAMNRSTPGLPVHHQLLESTETYVHWVGDAIQTSHPLSSPSPSAHNLSQHQDLFKGVSSSHQVAKVLVFQLQHQSFQ